MTISGLGADKIVPGPFGNLNPHRIRVAVSRNWEALSCVGVLVIRALLFDLYHGHRSLSTQPPKFWYGSHFTAHIYTHIHIHIYIYISTIRVCGAFGLWSTSLFGPMIVWRTVMSWHQSGTSGAELHQEPLLVPMSARRQPLDGRFGNARIAVYRLLEGRWVVLLTSNKVS